jgi:4Fe-4S binding domain
MNRIELTRNSLVKRALVNRYPQFVLFVAMLFGYIFAILAGLLSTPVGNSNFSIVFVWIAWWAILILVAVPLFGRGWCAICPIPLPGEWLQRGATLDPPQRKPRWANRRWPKFLSNIWLQNISFLLLALFSSVVLTSPKLTSVILAAMLFAAMGLGMVFERRSFCRYLCPVGGFIGIYSQTAPIELRVKDRHVCAPCKGKPCYNGSASGYGCPWNVFPPGLSKNTECGLCLECLRTCPYDNIAVNLRPFSADLERPSARLDEAFKAFIMLGSAMIYAGVLLGPWGDVKNAAYQVGTGTWFFYAAAFLAIIFVVLPLPLALCALRFQNPETFKKRFSTLSTALIPLGLAFWVAFSLSFVLSNGSYVLASLNDPLGLGWDMIGAANIAWRPLLPSFLVPAQTLTLVGGLIWSGHTAKKAASEVDVSSVPPVLYCLAATLVMLWLLI